MAAAIRVHVSLSLRLCCARPIHTAIAGARSFSQSQGYRRGFSGAWQEWLRGCRQQSASGARLARPLVIPALSIPFFSKGLDKKAQLTDRRVASHPILPASTPVEVSRIMLPDDSNLSGNVHGGVILHLIEQAGQIVANRHCSRNSDGTNPLTSALVRVDHMDFHQPMYVGEVAQIQAAVTYTSDRSMEVTVDVWAENVTTGQRRHTNSATLWYVACEANLLRLKMGQPLKATAVPQLKGLSEEEEEGGRRRYLAQKAERQARYDTGGSDLSCEGCSHYQVPPPSVTAEKHSVLASESTLARIVLPSDCYVTGHIMGGVLMKEMDNAAGICSARHCGTNVVTVSIDAIDFHESVRNGEVVFVSARMVFTSSKSMQIEVTTEAEGIGRHRRISNTAIFTFVSLGADYKAQKVPQLVIKSEEERARFEEGQRRYDISKKLRQEARNQK